MFCWAWTLSLRGTGCLACFLEFAMSRYRQVARGNRQWARGTTRHALFAFLTACMLPTGRYMWDVAPPSRSVSGCQYSCHSLLKVGGGCEWAFSRGGVECGPQDGDFRQGNDFQQSHAMFCNSPLHITVRLFERSICGSCADPPPIHN